MPDATFTDDVAAFVARRLERITDPELKAVRAHELADTAGKEVARLGREARAQAIAALRDADRERWTWAAIGELLGEVSPQRAAQYADGS